MTRVATVPGDPPRVAFAIGRNVGNAVVRNRLRRQLRALCREHAAGFHAGHDYLIGATGAAVGTPFGELDDALRRLLDDSAAAQ